MYIYIYMYIHSVSKSSPSKMQKCPFHPSGKAPRLPFPKAAPQGLPTIRVGRLMKSNDWIRERWLRLRSGHKKRARNHGYEHTPQFCIKKTSQRWIFGMFSRIELVWNWRLCKREPRKCMEKIRWIGGEERIVSAEVWCAWTTSK